MLDYDLNDRGSVSLYECVYQRIRDDILSGSIVAGEHLPSKRGLGAAFGHKRYYGRGRISTSLLPRGSCDRCRAVDILPMSYRGRRTVPRLKDVADRDAGSVAPGRAFAAGYPTCQKRRSMVLAFGGAR